MNGEDSNVNTFGREPIKLRKIIADNVTFKLRVILLAGFICAMILLRIILFFALPDFFLEIEGVEHCPSEIKDFVGTCNKVDFPTNDLWFSHIKDLEPSD